MRFISLLAILLVACGSPDKTDNYESEIKAHRKEVTKTFLIRESSPLKNEDRKYFVGLNYFEIDREYAVWAEYQALMNQGLSRLSTSGGEEREYIRDGILTFKLKGKDLQLYSYRSTDSPDLFIPFGDESNGKETYHAGRYVDMQAPDSNQVLLDFNKAYNPYCAYNDKWSCVIPPSENKLNIAVLAGERRFH